MPPEVRTTACPLDCPDLCRLAVHVEDERVVRVEAAADTSIRDGFICGKVRRIAAHVHGAERITTPLVRRGDQLRPASWDEALDLVAGTLAEVRARAGGEAILPYHYGGSNGWLTEGALASRLFRRLGATRLARTFCAVQSSAAMQGMYGAVPGCALPDYAHSELVLLWGVNPSATGIHLVPVLDELLARGGELIVVDPRRTPLARRASLHLAPRPGTDLPLALAALHVLFERGLADDAFLAAHAVGTAELARRAARWPLAHAAAVTGVPAADIEALARRWAAASPAVVRLGWGLERNRGGGGATAAVLALPAVAGKLGVRGGGFTLHTGDAGWGLDPEAAIAAPEPTTRTLNMNQLGRALDGERRWTDPAIEVVFVYNCNPASTAPAQGAVRRGLARPDVFTIVHDAVMTDTAALADVVLPATTFLEHRELRRGYGTIRLHDSPPVIAPVGQAWSNNRLFGALLDRLGLAVPGEPRTDDELADRIFAGPRGAELRAQLATRGYATPWPAAAPAPVLCADQAPATVDGKIHLVPAALDAEAPGGLHTYHPDPATEAYPLALISPALSTMISSTFGQLRTAAAAVELSPEDAAARGIASGDEVRLWNDLGEVRCVAQVTADVRPGVVSLPKGLWARHTGNGATANALIPDDLADLAGGACYNDARVQCARA
ncbi:MAG: molybdopterin-dependent oxidoreductase [Kofleriaceae bacterium]